MKKNLLVIACSVWNLSGLFAQGPANGDFENWTSFPPLNYENPTGWSSTNDLVSAASLYNVSKVSTPVSSGTYAAKLESIDVAGSPTPGILGLFIFNPIDQSIAPGEAFAARPDSLTGYYQYAPAGSDNFYVFGLLTKWNGNARDTIGNAVFTSGTALSTYNRFAVAFEYTSAATPDSVTLLFSSSNLDNPVVGSIAFLDKVSFVSNAIGANELQATPAVSVFPNPASDFISLSNLQPNSTIQICDLMGKSMFTKTLSSDALSIDLSSLSNGTYLLSINGRTQKVVIAK